MAELVSDRTVDWFGKSLQLRTYRLEGTLGKVGALYQSCKSISEWMLAGAPNDASFDIGGDICRVTRNG